MKSIGVKYLALVGSTVFFFNHMIACGAKNYKVSLEDDMQGPAQGVVDSGEGSLIPSSVDIPEGVHAANGWRSLPIEYQVGEQINDEQLAGVIKAMQTWETAVGRKLFKLTGKHASTTGDSFPDLFTSLTDTVNGHYLDSDWQKTGKSTYVLATTIWDTDDLDDQFISTADIRYNFAEYVFGDSLTLAAQDQKEIVDMESLALHELGHLLGLGHMDEDNDPYSIMNPSLFIGEGLTSRRLSKGDIDRIQSIYGCLGDACDRDKLIAILEIENTFDDEFIETSEE